MSNTDLQSLSEGYACSPYCLSDEHLCAQSSIPTPMLPPTSRNCSTTQRGLFIEDPASLDHVQGPASDGKTTIAKKNSAESCCKTDNGGTSICGTTSVSSSSSVYSSSDKHSKRPGIVAKSETSGRSSVISESQGSERSTSSSVGVTSISNDSTSSQGHVWQQKTQNSRAGLASKFSNQSTPYTFSRIKEKERNPLKWLRRRSEANIRHSNDIKSEQQQTDPDQPHCELKQSEDDEVNLRKQRPNNNEKIRPDLIDRMEKLEDKLDSLIDSHFSASKGSTYSTIACQALSGPEAKIEQCRQIQRKGEEDDGCNQKTGPHLQVHPIIKEERTQNPVQFPNTYLNKEEEQMQIWQALTAEIDSLTKSNNKLSSCIEALGSSGLIELIEILGSAIERLHSELASLRQQQNAINSEKTSLNAHEDSLQQQQQQQQKHLEIQANIIQRLGVLLGRREEQLKHEKRLNEKYNENIKALEKMVQSLELEWQRVIPLISNSGKASSCLKKGHHLNRAFEVKKGN